MDEHHAETDGNHEQTDLNSKMLQNTGGFFSQSAVKNIQIKEFISKMPQIAKETTPKPP